MAHPVKIHNAKRCLSDITWIRPKPEGNIAYIGKARSVPAAAKWRAAKVRAKKWSIALTGNKIHTLKYLLTNPYRLALR